MILANREVSQVCRLCVQWGRSGVLLTLTDDIVRQSKEYFKDVLNPTDMSSVWETESDNDADDSCITGKVIEAVKPYW